MIQCCVVGVQNVRQYEYYDEVRITALYNLLFLVLCELVLQHIHVYLYLF
jgi:hypothetical protein